MVRRYDYRTLGCLFAALSLFSEKTFADPSERILYEEGDVPIILATGHGGSATPEGWTERSNPGVLNAMDSYTRPLSQDLRKHLEVDHGIKAYWILNTVHRKYADVNREPGGKAYESHEGKAVYDAFHEKLDGAVGEAVERFGFAFVIDIHGQSKHPADVYLGTARRKSMGDLLRHFGEGVLLGPNSLQALLTDKSYSTPPNVRPPGPYEIPGGVSGGYITHHYGRRIDADAVQIEIHGRLRKDETLRPILAEDLADIIAKFYDAHLIDMMDSRSEG